MLRILISRSIVAMCILCIGLYTPDHVNCSVMLSVKFDIVPSSQLTLTRPRIYPRYYPCVSPLLLSSLYPCVSPLLLSSLYPCVSSSLLPSLLSSHLPLHLPSYLPSLLALYSILASILCRALCFALAPTLVFSLCLDLAFLVNLPVSGPRPLQGCRNRELFFGLAASSASRVRPDLCLA